MNINNFLNNAIASEKLNHAYIIACEDDDTRLAAAEKIARTLLCENGNGCGECHSCKQLKSGFHPDLVRVTHEKPTTLSVKEIRDQLCDTADRRPFQSRYKIYIVDDAQLMNDHGQNALLKTIEEPPEYIVILLLTDNDKKLLDTIRSRCVTLRPEGSKKTYGNPSEMENDEFLGYARDMYHDILLYKRTGEDTALVVMDHFDEVKKLAGELDYQQILEAIEEIDKAEKRISMSVNPEITMSLLEDMIHIER